MLFKAMSLGMITKTVSVNREEKNVTDRALELFCFMCLYFFCLEKYYTAQNKREN